MCLELVSAIFYQILIFAPNDSLSKPGEIFFYFISKALFVLEIFNSLYFLLFLSTLSRFKMANGRGVSNDVMHLLHNFADIIFGITQKPLFITPSNLVR